MEKATEYFDKIINSGMCNSIINGYILLAFDIVGVKLPKLVKQERDTKAKIKNTKYNPSSIRGWIFVLLKL